jgi:hypothetical protein
VHSITAVIACYRDAEAIPVMYRRRNETFTALGVDYEIIFVNDASRERDRRVPGISHSRNFGSQVAVRAFAGFRQPGVDYVRPKRVFGVTTNNLRRNIGWAKKGIFSTRPVAMGSSMPTEAVTRKYGPSAISAAVRNPSRRP